MVSDCLIFSVIESHPDSFHEDLRLDRPFPTLTQYCDSLDLSKMTNKVNIYKCIDFSIEVYSKYTNQKQISIYVYAHYQHV